MKSLTPEAYDLIKARFRWEKFSGQPTTEAGHEERMRAQRDATLRQVFRGTGSAAPVPKITPAATAAPTTAAAPPGSPASRIGMVTHHTGHGGNKYQYHPSWDSAGFASHHGNWPKLAHEDAGQWHSDKRDRQANSGDHDGVDHHNGLSMAHFGHANGNAQEVKDGLKSAREGHLGMQG